MSSNSSSSPSKNNPNMRKSGNSTQKGVRKSSSGSAGPSRTSTPGHRHSSGDGSSGGHGQSRHRQHHPVQGSSQYHGSSSGMPGSSSTGAGFSSTQELPSSVRNAPTELRTAIRRRQNNESAKRSRERKRIEEVEMMRKMQENDSRIKNLEDQIEHLTAALTDDDQDDGRSNRRPNPPPSPSTKPGFYGDPF